MDHLQQQRSLVESEDKIDVWLNERLLVLYETGGTGFDKTVTQAIATSTEIIATKWLLPQKDFDRISTPPSPRRIINNSDLFCIICHHQECDASPSPSSSSQRSPIPVLKKSPSSCVITPRTTCIDTTIPSLSRTESNSKILTKQPSSSNPITPRESPKLLLQNNQWTRLPCGHCIHKSCVKKWFIYQMLRMVNVSWSDTIAEMPPLPNVKCPTCNRDFVNMIFLTSTDWTKYYNEVIKIYYISENSSLDTTQLATSTLLSSSSSERFTPLLKTKSGSSHEASSTPSHDVVGSFTDSNEFKHDRMIPLLPLNELKCKPDLTSAVEIPLSTKPTLAFSSSSSSLWQQKTSNQARLDIIKSVSVSTLGIGESRQGRQQSSPSSSSYSFASSSSSSSNNSTTYIDTALQQPRGEEIMRRNMIDCKAKEIALLYLQSVITNTRGSVLRYPPYDSNTQLAHKLFLSSLKTKILTTELTASDQFRLDEILESLLSLTTMPTSD